MLKIGLKIWAANIDQISELIALVNENRVDYIELFANLDSFDRSINYWKKLNIPINIHASHYATGVNLADPSRRQTNKKHIQEARRYADAFDSEYIIVHPGVLDKGRNSIEECIYQISTINDRRLTIENVPGVGINNEKMIGSTPVEIQRILKQTTLSFCLDFGHAICSANFQKKDPIKMIELFSTLKPKVFHLTDGEYSSIYDSHLNYGSGDFPLEKLLCFVDDSSMVTNEAVRKNGLLDFKKDYEYLHNLYKYLKVKDC